MSDIIYKLINAAIQLFNLQQAKKFDFVDEEVEILKANVQWMQNIIFRVDGIMILTNKRLRFQYTGEYLSYPLESIVSINLVSIWKIFPTGYELVFDDGRKETFSTVIGGVTKYIKREIWLAEILKARMKVNQLEEPSFGIEKQNLLYNNLSFSFNENELKTLCFDLGIDYESLAGHNKLEKTHALVRKIAEKGTLEQALMKGKKLRPYLNWEHKA